MRRVPYALAALAALLVTTPSSATTCPLLTDPVGDGGPVVASLAQSLDIVSADLASGSTSVVVVLRTASLAPDPATAAGAEWRVRWQLGSSTYVVTVRRTVSGYSVQALGPTAPPTFTVDVPNATFTWQFPRTAFAELATPGATFSSIAAITAWTATNADAASTSQTYVDQDPGCISAP